MKNLHLLAATLILGAGLLEAQRTSAITLNFGNVPNAQINFAGTGDNFFFSPVGGDQFKITGSSGAGDSIGDTGATSGSFHIGAITVAGSLQTAPVTGNGTVTIHDGISDLVGSVTWSMIQTKGTQGSLNLFGILNLSSLTYSGSQTDLKALAAYGIGTEVLSFTFIPGKTLTQLTQNGMTFHTSFSGTLASVPDSGMTMFLLGSAMTGLAVYGKVRGRRSANS